MTSRPTTGPSASLAEQLSRAVADCYRVFAGYSLGESLDVCRCPVCVDDAYYHRLSTVPLHALDTVDLAQYLYSAHSLATTQAEDQLKYFLPRLIELCTEGVWPHYATEYTFSKLASCSYPAAWPIAEATAVHAAFQALFAQELLTASFDSPLELVIEAFVNAGDSADDFLQQWDDDPSETASMALAGYLANRMHAAARDPSGEPGGSPDVLSWMSQLRAWAMRPVIAIRLEHAIRVASTPERATQLSLAHQRFG